jgi:hypothetical protein
MRMATGLAVIAVGAILAFAVNGHPSFLNIQVAGWVIMLTGIVGLVVPRRGYGWMRRQLHIQQVQRGRGQGRTRYVMRRALNPGTGLATTVETPDEPTAQGAVADDTEPLISEDISEEVRDY